MKILYLSIAIFFMMSESGVGQSLSGNVQDINGKGVPLVNVFLHTVQDSTIIKVTAADALGNFSFDQIKYGDYLLSATLVGHKKIFSPIKFSEQTTNQKTTLIIVEDPKTLGEVVVTGQRPFLEQLPDRLVVNVANSIVATGGTVLEVLEKSPGITIDQQNEILQFRGKTGVKVLIDGKPSNLSDKDLFLLFQGMPSNNIENIELMGSPGAAYDASGSAGVINIKMKKNKELGFNASLSAGFTQGIFSKGNASGSINYRGKKINLFSNVAINLGKYQMRIRAKRILNDTIYDQHLLQRRDPESYSLRAGADFIINDKNVIGILSSASLSVEDWVSQGNTPVIDNMTKTHIQTLSALSSAERNRKLVNTNLNYRHTLRHGELTLDIDYGYFSGRNNSFQPNTYFDADGSVLSEVITYYNTPTNINIYTAKLDVRNQIRFGTINYGLRFAKVVTENTFEFFTDVNGEIIKVLDRSYVFKYDENVSAAYFTVKSKLNKSLNLDAGVRVEGTISQGDLDRLDSFFPIDNNVRREYVNCFPNALLTWNPNQKHQVSLNYSRRIDRPVYQDLNPFEMKLDELTYVKGNSFLKPQYTDKFALTHTWNQKLSTELGFSHTQDFVTQVNDTIDNKTYAQQQNLSSVKTISVNLSTPLTITNWWTGFVSVFYNHMMFKGQIGSKPIELNAPVYGASMQQSFSLGRGFRAELLGYYNGRLRPIVTWKTQPMGAIDIGIEKLLFNKRASIKVSVTDIFRTSIPFRAVTDFGGLYMAVWVNRESQTAKINFNYRFGSNQVKSLRQRSSGLENESQRVKEG